MLSERGFGLRPNSMIERDTGLDSCLDMFLIVGIVAGPMARLARQ